MKNLGKLHLAALRALQHARRTKAIAQADAAEKLMAKALADYYSDQISATQLATFLEDLGKGQTKSLTTHYGEEAINLPKVQ